VDRKRRSAAAGSGHRFAAHRHLEECRCTAAILAWPEAVISVVRPGRERFLVARSIEDDVEDTGIDLADRVVSIKITRLADARATLAHAQLELCEVDGITITVDIKVAIAYIRASGANDDDIVECAFDHVTW
jgi:hypothetical protein